jgi:prepilin-type N-terminal cleavage/methylation domain-containing protein
MNIQQAKAFSLTELMIAVFIFVIAVGAIYGVMLVGNASWKTYENSIAAQREARMAISKMVRDLREATAINPLEGNNTYTVSFSRGGNDIAYQWTGIGSSAHNLRRTIDAIETVIAQDITALSVSQDSASVTVAVTATRESAGGQAVSVTMSEKIAKRI